MKNKEDLIRITVSIPWLFLWSWICQLLWNAIIQPLFNAPHIGYWQMCGIYLLIRFLLPKKENND